MSARDEFLWDEEAERLRKAAVAAAVAKERERTLRAIEEFLAGMDAAPLRTALEAHLLRDLIAKLRRGESK